jgi:hypothetical protein
MSKAVKKMKPSTRLGSARAHFRLTLKPRELKPISEALGLQRRYRHITDDKASEMQTRAEEKWLPLLVLNGNRLPF